MVCVCSVVSDSLQPHGHGSIPARILEWAAISSSRGSSQPRDGSCVSCIGRQIFFFFFNHWATSVRPVQYFIFTICSSKSFSFFIIFYWIFEYIKCIKLFLKKKKLCSSIKSFIFLEIVHSLRPMLSFFDWRISSTARPHRFVWGCQHPFITGDYSFWVAAPPQTSSCLTWFRCLSSSGSLRPKGGVGRRHFVIAVALLTALTYDFLHSAYAL